MTGHIQVAALALTAAVAVMVTWLLVALRLGRTRQAAVAKTSASLAFVALGALALAGSWFSLLLVVGLVLGAIGDVALLGHSRRSFLFGLVSFLLGHVAYAIAFLGHGTQLAWLFVLAFAAPAVTVAWWLHPKAGRLAVPVHLYIGVASAMAAVAWAAVLDGLWWIAGLGATLFYVSDIAVARDRFVAPGWINRAWGLPMYYAGQVLIAWVARGA